ncbi:hypothetical protein GCM10011348_40600 [Marinobacterium nitratireducens]|uniref:VOC domain-containing protein n=1 Tax=Marinobacterium nitratireducens TaxID=518897 RepID=A0A917ZPP8_9GAMM|nr:4-hydroxyphenylpyruvate dioxygenase [Marinobacterium nitratireducens]GGO87421.1 hypothetical protein GCM10011348_40600 [Marinobacterium nitratireducens]
MQNRPTVTEDEAGNLIIEGLEFVEFAVSDPTALVDILRLLGFRATARHRSKDVTLYQSGAVNFIVNATAGSFAQEFARQHGPSICAMALRVPNATTAYQLLLDQGAWDASTSAGAMELNIPAIESIGGTQIYLVDRYGDDLSIYDVDFRPLPAQDTQPHAVAGLSGLTLATGAGRGDEWRDFLCRLFGFETQGDASLKSPDHSFMIEIAEKAGSAFDLADEGISALRLTAADPAALIRHLQANGIQADALNAGAFSLRLPIGDAAFDIQIAPQA